MNINKQQIREWVESRSERIAKHIELKGDQSMHDAVGEIIDQCIKDLAPKSEWVSVDSVKLNLELIVPAARYEGPDYYKGYHQARKDMLSTLPDTESPK